MLRLGMQLRLAILMGTACGVEGGWFGGLFGGAQPAAPTASAAAGVPSECARADPGGGGLCADCFDRCENAEAPAEVLAAACP